MQRSVVHQMSVTCDCLSCFQNAIPFAFSTCILFALVHPCRNTLSMSFNLAASAAPPSPLPADTAADAPQRQAQDEAAESHCDAVQAPEAAISRVALRESALVVKLGCPSPQLCSALFRLRSAASVCASMAAQLQLPRAQFDVLSALRCSGLCVYEVGVAGEERLRAMGGGGVGLLVLRMTATGGACGRDVKRLMMSVMRHIAAVHATATPEAFFERGQRECNDGLYASAAESWECAVDLKHVHAHTLLADMLFWGRPNVPEDHKRAFELASAGAGMGCAHSKGVLGCCYAYGRGVARDRAKGLELGRESAAAGSCMGQFVVGKCCHAGWGVAQDYTEAVRSYRFAAAQGHLIAQYNLGFMFQKGQGVTQDYAEAVRLYRLAAAQGDAAAQNSLGALFYQGQGVAQDYAEAVRLYRLAAAQGDADAQFNLGGMLEDGRGVLHDISEAIQWYRVAAAQGDSDSTAALRRLGA